MAHEEVVENKLLLTPEEREKVFEDYPCLDPSFEDDYKTEVELLLEAQLAKAKPIIEKQMLGQFRKAMAVEFHKALDESHADPFPSKNLNKEHQILWRGEANAFSGVIDFIDTALQGLEKEE